MAPALPKLPKRRPRPGRGRLAYVEAPRTSELRWNPGSTLVVAAIVAIITGLSIWLALD